MEEIMKASRNIQNDIAQQKQDMKDMEKNIKETINKNIDEKFNRIESRTHELEQKIEAQQKAIDFLDKQMRKKNIIFFGIPESEQSYGELLNLILEVINKNMSIPCPDWEIETVARLGKYNGRLRPVVVKLTTTGRKLQLLKKKKTLEVSGIYMKEDYTPAVLAKRKELQEEFKHRRLSGEKVILPYDKIVTLKPREQVTGPPKGKTYNKRFLSESPEDKNNSKALNSAEQSKQVPKKK
ncbi:unnamed protein product [Arctia plantaginis]|uniref:Endonuclease-reverse transcriptase n=1 Tax=Arctia plantaginis TaxID=874455 RepID=A0A8S0ZIK6_ARCPL|nr:unnamed protein product [Arctia plantaginis]